MKSLVAIGECHHEHCLGQVAYKVLLSMAKQWNVALRLPPQPLDVVGVCQGLRVDEVNAVVHCQMLIPLFLQALVGTPAIRYDGGT